MRAHTAYLAIFFFGFLLLDGISAVAQSEIEPTWFITRGGKNTDEAWGVDTDSQGNVYWATHETVPGPLADIYLYKLSPDGSEIWRAKWGGMWNEQAYIVVVEEPYVYVAGAVWKGIWLASLDMSVIAFNTSDGSVVWDFTWDQGFGYEEVDGLVVESDAIYLAGWTTGENSRNDLAVLKLSIDGKLIWSQTWGTPAWDEANGHIVVDAKNVYVAGRYSAPGELAGGDAVLAAFRKTDGVYMWHKTWGGNGMDDAFGMAGDGSSLYVVGITNSFGHGSQIFLVKYDLEGNLVWENTWGGARGEAARAIAVTADGGVLVGGKTNSYGAGQNDIVILKFTADGELAWYKTWGGSGIDEAHEIALHGDSVYIDGETFSHGSGKSDALLLKVNIGSACVKGDVNGDGVIASIDALLALRIAAELIDPTTQEKCAADTNNDGNVGSDDTILILRNAAGLASPGISPEYSSLLQNFPNPFNPETWIPYHLSVANPVIIRIFNATGGLVTTLDLGYRNAGIYASPSRSAHWDGRNEAGEAVASGIYFYNIQAGEYTATRKMIVMR